MSPTTLFKKVFAPYRFKVLRGLVGTRSLKVLDVGCGNDSCRLTRHWLNVAEYHGIDREYWHGAETEYGGIDKLYILDLENSALDDVPDEAFDVIIASHVVEHLSDGLATLKQLVSKLAIGGVIYVETPSHRTINLPSAIGFLNFYDDPTHKRVYSRFAIADVFFERKLRVLQCSYRRDLFRLIFFTPVAVLVNCLYTIPFRRRFFGTGLWDLLGVATVVVGQKPTPSISEQVDH